MPTESLIEQAVAVCGSRELFATHLAAHLEPGGVILSGESYFLMARPVLIHDWALIWLDDEAVHEAIGEEMLDPFLRFKDPNCWMIWCVCGDGRQALRDLATLHGTREFCCFQRRGRLKVRATRQSVISKLQ